MAKTSSSKVLLKDGQILTIGDIKVECFQVLCHTGWADDLGFVFAHREKVCSVWFKQKPRDPDAPYDAYDESGDTEEKDRTVRLQKQNRR